MNREKLNIICLYVDDLIINENKHNKVKNLKFNISIGFYMIVVGDISYFLNLKFIAIMKD